MHDASEARHTGQKAEGLQHRILTVGVPALLSVVILLRKSWTVRFSCLLLTLYFLAAAALLVRGFFRQIRYNLYSCNTVIYFGFSLVFISIALTYALMFLGSRNVFD